MIDKTQIIEAVTKSLKKLPIGHYLDLRTYKRNRSVIIVKMTDDDLLVIENGFFKENFSKSSINHSKTPAIHIYKLYKLTEED